jgi:pyruvate/2-oxoglutarate dehydrogenase complex dihydrolipoamide dehydrogenase (E3) component
VDWPRIRARKAALVSNIVSNLERSLRQNPRIQLLRGTARFVGTTRLSVDDQEIEAERIIVASGVAPAIPDIPGLAEAGFETNETVMDMGTLPRSMVVIGGGPEGMEFSQMFHRFGVRVTVLQRRDRVLPREDDDVSRELEDILREEGIDIRTGARLERVERRQDGTIAVSAQIKGRTERFDCDRILVTAGRRPHELKEMELARAGIEGDPLRGITTDETLRTTANKVWAIGDVIGRVQYTHFATYTAGIAIANALKSEERRYDIGRVPGAVFTDPEVASVGLTEQEAIRRGRKVKVGKQAFTGVARARAMGETAGFVKFVVDASTEELLGMHVLSHMGADLLPQGILMMHTAEQTILPLTECICVIGDMSSQPSIRPLDDRLPDRGPGIGATEHQRGVEVPQPVKSEAGGERWPGGEEEQVRSLKWGEVLPERRQGRNGVEHQDGPVREAPPQTEQERCQNQQLDHRYCVHRGISHSLQSVELLEDVRGVLRPDELVDGPREHEDENPDPKREQRGGDPIRPFQGDLLVQSSSIRGTSERAHNASRRRTTRVWVSVSPAAPSGWPSFHGTANARGGRTARVMSGSIVMEAVEMPCRSTSACTRPTAWWQKGQTGTSSATSTWSATRRAAASGALERVSRPGAVIDPMKDRCLGATEPISPAAASSRSRSSGKATFLSCWIPV